MTRHTAWRNLRNTHGFTLVEVIVVLVIIAILAAITIPSMTGWIERSRKTGAIAECRAAVLSAQTLASEYYINGVPFDESGVTPLAGLSGTVSDIELSGNNTVLHLTYTNMYTTTFCRYPDDCEQHTQIFSFDDQTTDAPTAAQWVTGKEYAVGDEIVVEKTRFRCIRAHSSGDTQATSNPMDRSNKSTWIVIGFEPGADNAYFSRLHYAQGVVVTYTGQSYKRTSYDPSSSPTPYNGSLYWELP